MEEKRPTAEQMAKFKKNAQDKSLSAEIRAKFQAIVDKFSTDVKDVEEKIEGKPQPKKRAERKPATSRGTKKPATSRGTKKPATSRGTKKTATDIEQAKAEIKAKTGKTEEECEAIIEQYRLLRTKAQQGKIKAQEANDKNRTRVKKLDEKGDLIEGTNIKTADAVIESTTKDVAEKIEQQIEAVEDKAEKEAKAEVAKDTTIKTPKDKKDAVKEKVDEKVKEGTKVITERVVIDTSALLTSIATSLGKFDKDSQKEFLIKLRSDINKLLAKYAFGGMTDGAVQTMNVQQSNMSSSSVNPTMFAEGGGVDDSKNKKIMESYREWVFDLRNQSYPKMSVSQAIKQATEYMYSYYSKEELIEAIKNDRQIEMFGMENTWLNALKRAKKRKMAKGGGVPNLSIQETTRIANATAKALGKDFKVTKGSVEVASFDLDFKGVPYDGGSYNIQENGDVINMAISPSVVYYNYKTKKKFAKGGGVGDGDEELHFWEVTLKMPNGEIVYESVIADSKEDAEYYGELTDSANEGAKVLSVKSMGKETYANGGEIKDLDSVKVSNSLKSQLRKKLGLKPNDDLDSSNSQVYFLSYSDNQKGTLFNKVMIDYLEKEYPQDIVVEKTKNNGKDAFIIGNTAERYIEAVEDFGGRSFDDYAIDDDYFEILNEMELKEFNKYLDDLEAQENFFDREEALDWLMEMRANGYYDPYPNRIEIDRFELDEDLEAEGIVKFRYARGGGVGKYTKIDLLVKKPYGNEEMEIAKFKGTGDAIISASALNENSPSNYEYSVRNSKKFADGGVVGQEIVFDDSGEENTGVIKDITNLGDYIVKADDGRTLLAQRELDVISLGAMRSASTEAPKKRFGFFDEGGNVSDLDYSDILSFLKDKLEEAVQEVPSHFENSYNAEGHEVEHESRDGFIPYTDGGYEVRWFEYLSYFSGSGYSLPTSALDKEKDRQIEYNYTYAKERFMEEYPEIVEELGEENIDYNSLYDADYGDEAEQLSEWENDYDGEGTIMCEIGAYYYSPNNDRGIDGKHTLRLFGLVNLESPYHRSGNLEDRYDIDITFDSIEELELEMNEELETIIRWFEGYFYNESTEELRIRRMAKGGGVTDKLSYADFVETLRDNDKINAYTGKETRGMEMYYLPSGHPFLGLKFPHKNKRKAYNEYVNIGNKIGFDSGLNFLSMAKGGLTEHGLRVGDSIIEEFGGDEIGVRSSKGDFHRINLDKGERFAKGGKLWIDTKTKGGLKGVKPSRKNSFTRQAQKRGITSGQLASKVLANPSRYKGINPKSAQLVKNMGVRKHGGSIGDILRNRRGM
jgi:hypothetical protein